MEPDLRGDRLTSSATAYYTPSGRFSAVGLASMALTGAIALVAVVALEYALQANLFHLFSSPQNATMDPDRYSELKPHAILLKAMMSGWDFGLLIKTYLAVQCGTLLGAAVAGGARLGKVRSPTLAGAVGGMLGVIGSWMHCAIILYFVTSWAGSRITLANWLTKPALTMEALSLFGVWGSGGYSGQYNYSEYIMLIWAIMCLLGSIGVAAFYPYLRVKNSPFCERCGSWPVPIPKKFGFVPDIDAFKTRLERGDFSVVKDLDAPEPQAFAEATVLRCPKCGDTAWLSIENVKKIVDSKEKISTNKENLASNMCLTREALTTILGVDSK